ncbi:MAG TPA: MFS transporter [Ilumatobacter sp.]|nr:MFS transporter [Ilumatobacter sp.]
MSDRPSLSRPFLTVWLGQTLSLVGSMVSGVGVAVWVYLETGSAAWLGALTAMAAAPALLAGPFLPIVDRVPRRRMMIIADTVASVGTIAALALAATDRLEVWHLVVAAFIGGIGSAFQFPAFQAAVPLLVDREALGRANALNQFGPAVGVVVGPVVATPLVAWWGITAVLFVDVVTFLVAIVCTTVVPFGDAVPTDTVQGPQDDGSWRSVVAWLRGDGRPLVVLLVAMAITNFFLAFFNVSIIGLATNLGGATRAGLVLGAGGVSMLVGTIVLGSMGVARRRVRTFGAALVVTGVGCLVAAARPQFAVLIVGVVIALGMVPAVSAAVATIYHERVPHGMQGRVFGLRAAIGRGLEPLGALTAGIVIATVAEPAMADGEIGGRTLGRVIGTGTDRGAAAVLAGVGLSLVVVGVWVMRSWINGVIDGGPNAASAPSDGSDGFHGTDDAELPGETVTAV